MYTGLHCVPWCAQHGQPELQVSSSPPAAEQRRWQGGAALEAQGTVRKEETRAGTGRVPSRHCREWQRRSTRFQSIKEFKRHDKNENAREIELKRQVQQKGIKKMERELKSCKRQGAPTVQAPQKVAQAAASRVRENAAT